MTSTVEFISLVVATALLVAAVIVQAISSPAVLVTLTQDDKFEMQCNRLREFLVLRCRFPRDRSDAPKDERRLYNFIRTSLRDLRNRKLKESRRNELDAIHHGILSWKSGYDIIARDTEEWTSVFANLAAKSNLAEEVKSFCFHSTCEPYVWSANSFEEHIIRRTGCHRVFQPNDCHLPVHYKALHYAGCFFVCNLPRLP